MWSSMLMVMLSRLGMKLLMLLVSDFWNLRWCHWSRSIQGILPRGHAGPGSVRTSAPYPHLKFLTWILGKLRQKACGPDGWTAELLLRLPDPALDRLSQLLTLFENQKRWPDSLTHWAVMVSVLVLVTSVPFPSGLSFNNCSCRLRVRLCPLLAAVLAAFAGSCLAPVSA